MKSLSQSNGVVLNGGLGNQLFQLAAVLANESAAEISVELSLGTIRGETESPELIKDFKLPIGYKLIRERKLLFIKRKMANRILVLGERSSTIQRIKLGIYSYLLEMILFLTHGNHIKVVTPQRMQEYSKGKFKQDCLLIGYFQTSKWASLPHVFANLSKLQLNNSKQVREVQKFIRTYSINDGIHFRLGDYAYEPSLGILPDSYYAKALRKISRKNSNLIVFSDSPAWAVKRLNRMAKTSFVVAPNTFSSAQTLDLMRNCENFIVANSSLSWWGAYLGYSRKKTRKIIGPDPWFRELAFDSKLLPVTWDKVSSWT